MSPNLKAETFNLNPMLLLTAINRNCPMSHQSIYTERHLLIVFPLRDPTAVTLGFTLSHKKPELLLIVFQSTVTPAYLVIRV